MNIKIVKFSDGRYAIKRGWWIFREYADIDDIRNGLHIYWWDDVDREYIDYYTTPDVKELEKYIESYNSSPKFTERTMKTYNIKL